MWINQECHPYRKCSATTNSSIPKLVLESSRIHRTGVSPCCLLRCFTHHTQFARLQYWAILLSYFTLTVLTSHNWNRTKWSPLFRQCDHSENTYGNIGWHTVDTLFTSVSLILPQSRQKYSALFTHTHKYTRSHSCINMCSLREQTYTYRCTHKNKTYNMHAYSHKDNISFWAWNMDIVPAWPKLQTKPNKTQHFLPY